MGVLQNASVIRQRFALTVAKNSTVFATIRAELLLQSIIAQLERLKYLHCITGVPFDDHTDYKSIFGDLHL